MYSSLLVVSWKLAVSFRIRITSASGHLKQMFNNLAVSSQVTRFHGKVSIFPPLIHYSAIIVHI
jgi:hypothetical protein